jgi:hypothetical protein
MKPPFDAGAQFNEIVSKAHLLVELLHEAVAAGGSADLAAAAALIAGQIGYVADRALGRLGQVQVLGDADEWLLSPRARGEVAA